METGQLRERPADAFHTERCDGQYSVQWPSDIDLETFLKLCVDIVDRDTCLTVYTTMGHLTTRFGRYLISRALARLGSKLIPGPDYDDRIEFIHIHSAPALTWQPATNTPSAVGLIFDEPTPDEQAIDYLYAETAHTDADSSPSPPARPHTS